MLPEEDSTHTYAQNVWYVLININRNHKISKNAYFSFSLKKEPLSHHHNSIITQKQGV